MILNAERGEDYRHIAVGTVELTVNTWNKSVTFRALGRGVRLQYFDFSNL